MRAILLLVLGAGLVWFVWRGFGPGKAVPGDAHASAPGAMIALEAPEEAAKPQAEGAASAVPTHAPTPEVTTTAPPATVPAAKAAPEARNESEVPVAAEPTPAVASAISPVEIAAAQELLRDPADLAAWLATRGVDLPADRREIAAGFVHAFAGREADTRAAIERAQAGGGIPAGERELAQRIVVNGAPGTSVESASPISRAAAMKHLERVGLAHLTAGEAREAAESFSRLLLAEVASPWPADAGRLAGWSAKLSDAQRGNRWNRRGTWRSTEIVVQPGDSLISVRKRAVAADPNLVVCTGQIARANQLDGEVIHPGAKLRIPLDPVSVLVDLDAHWAFYMAGDEVVAAWPVGVGKESSATRVGTFTVGEKTKEPMWFPQGRKPVPYGDPENPLGTRWIAWNDREGNTTRLGFHGTNEPDSIGRDASLGCIRMRTADVEELFEVLPRGATVRVVP